MRNVPPRSHYNALRETALAAYALILGFKNVAQYEITKRVRDLGPLNSNYYLPIPKPNSTNYRTPADKLTQQARKTVAVTAPPPQPTLTAKTTKGGKGAGAVAAAFKLVFSGICWPPPTPNSPNYGQAAEDMRRGYLLGCEA